MPKMTVPYAEAASVQKLRVVLGTEREAVRLRIVTEPGDRDRNCYVNVRDRINRDGGGMQLGWAVWQHSQLFIEAEPHAVLDPGNGQPWIDCTPHVMPDGDAVEEILFIPDDNATYDFNTTELLDNVRVPLIDDPRLSKALKLYSEKIALMNSVPGIDVPLPQDVAGKVFKIEVDAALLLAELMGTPVRQAVRSFAPAERPDEKIGRNDPCPCGSGKRFKKCHGRW